MTREDVENFTDEEQEKTMKVFLAAAKIGLKGMDQDSFEVKASHIMIEELEKEFGVNDANANEK